MKGLGRGVHPSLPINTNLKLVSLNIACYSLFCDYCGCKPSPTKSSPLHFGISHECCARERIHGRGGRRCLRCGSCCTHRCRYCSECQRHSSDDDVHTGLAPKHCTQRAVCSQDRHLCGTNNSYRRCPCRCGHSYFSTSHYSFP